MEPQSMPWVNYDEALARVRAVGDTSLEQFVMRAVTLVVRRFEAGAFPDGKLDMLYFVEIMIDLYQQKDALVRVLNGEDLRWFGDSA
jgi:hypothetical protein